MLKMKLWEDGYAYRYTVNELPRLAMRRYTEMARRVKALDRDKLWRTLGVMPVAKRRAGTTGLWMLAAGAVVGALAALALAPMRGSQLRGQMRDKARALMADRHGAAEGLTRESSPARA